MRCFLCSLRCLCGVVCGKGVFLVKRVSLMKGVFLMKRALLMKRGERFSQREGNNYQKERHEQQTPKIETDLDSLAINTGSFIFRLCW